MGLAKASRGFTGRGERGEGAWSVRLRLGHREHPLRGGPPPPPLVPRAGGRALPVNPEHRSWPLVSINVRTVLRT